MHSRCQSCQTPLRFADEAAPDVLERLASDFARGQPELQRRQRQPRAALLAASLGGLKMDESFVVLPKGNNAPSARGKAAAAVDESFVMLHETGGGLAPPLPPPPTAPQHVAPPAPTDADADADAGAGASASADAATTSSVGAYDGEQATTLQRLFDLASSGARIEQPLCGACVRALTEVFNADLAELQETAAAYEASLAELRGDHDNAAAAAGSDDDDEAPLAREVAAADEEERQLQAEVQALEEQLRRSEEELRQAKRVQAEVDELEKKYWRMHHAFQHELAEHQEQRDALLGSMEIAREQLQALRRTNVVNDVFFIWHDGPFGTINNFRLGRLPGVQVEWSEINAAWGQACLLLHTMARLCRIQFKCARLLPMGSFPRISDGKTTYELFGPVKMFDKLWSNPYDKAMTLYLGCLREFADFAYSKDPTFDLPYAIDSEKGTVGEVSIRLSKEEKWTRALKFMLTDLKWCLGWMVSSNVATPISADSTAPQDD